MRKAIFKQELEASFMSYELTESAKMEVRKVLFENPLDITKQYLLKKEITDIKSIKGILKTVVSNNDFISDVLSLFQIDEDLELPIALRKQLARKEDMALFVGAGVSKLLGIPLWNDLSKKAIYFLYKRKLLTFSEAEKIINDSISPKQKLSIFHHILPKKEAQIFYEKELSPDKKLLGENPYDELVKIDIPKLTSNLDHVFWNALEKYYLSTYSSKDVIARPFHVYSDFNKSTPIKSSGIYQVHGSYKNLENYSIITMRDYLENYFQDSDLREFLREFFNRYAVIFIGCGMEEFEILQDLVKSGRQHHVLVGTYLSEINLLRLKKEYFENTLGIKAHGYYLDFNGYERLLNVIKSWVKKIIIEMKGGFYDKVGEFSDIKL